MSVDLLYEIVRYGNEDNDAPVRERVQLLSADGALLLCDADGIETPCEGVDVGRVISSAQSLRKIRADEEVRITCSPEIAAQLPFLLEPAVDDNSGGCCAKVNGADWIAFPTLEGERVMLPSWDEFEGPEMSPCWAEVSVEEGEWNPLIGFTSIGVLSPGVAVEFARCDPGGLGSEMAVALRPFDDFATVFVAWLLNHEVLEAVWYGDSAPLAPTERLFVDAAAAEDHWAQWNSEMNAESDDDDDDDDDDSSYWAAASLRLHLPDELIDLLRVHLGSRNQNIRPS